MSNLVGAGGERKTHGRIMEDDSIPPSSLQTTIENGSNRHSRAFSKEYTVQPGMMRAYNSLQTTEVNFLILNSEHFWL